jgi:hypothetical protein
MSWEQVERNWKQLKSNVVEQWDHLEHPLASRVRETNESADDAEAFDLTDWQQRLNEFRRFA